MDWASVAQSGKPPINTLFIGFLSSHLTFPLPHDPSLYYLQINLLASRFFTHVCFWNIKTTILLTKQVYCNPAQIIQLLETNSICPALANVPWTSPHSGTNWLVLRALYFNSLFLLLLSVSHLNASSTLFLLLFFLAFENTWNHTLSFFMERRKTPNSWIFN